MQRQVTYLADLVPRARGQKIRVRVLDIQPPQSGARGPYQRMIFVDEKGSRMNCTLFGIDTEVYKTIIKRGNTYNITNAMVKVVDARYETYPGERQLYFTNSTEVELANAGEPSEAAAYTIADVPPSAGPEERFDLMFVALHVEAEKIVHTKNGATLTVREMFVTDDSTDKVILVSAWNKMTMRQFSEMAVVMKTDPVVLVTALKVSTFEKFSLATTLSSELVFNSTSPRATELREWAATNKTMLERRLIEGHPHQSIYPTTSTTVKDVLSKNGDSVIEGEVFKIDVRILDFIKENLHITLGCSACGRSCDSSLVTAGQAATCTHCFLPMTTEPKLFFRFKCTDGSGTLTLDAYTKNTEKMFLVDSTTLYNLDDKGRLVLINRAQKRFREDVISLIIAPTKNLLTMHGVIKWVLRDVLP